MTRFARLLAIAVIASPAGAQGYYVEARAQSDGGALVEVKYDTDSPVEYRIGVDTIPEGEATEVGAAIEAAFQTWQDVECATIEFVRGDDETGEVEPMHWMTTSDIYILVFWSDDPAIWGSRLGVGRADWVHDGTGRLVGGEIILNSRDHSWSASGESGKMDIQSVVTALVGKSLGITSTMEGNATYGSYRPGDTTKRDLGPDDIAALQYLYGDGSCMPDLPEAVCVDGMTTLPDGGVGDCPPDIMTAPADGGTATPRDGGTAGGTDSGSGPADGGTTPGMPGDGDDGGCGCVAVGATSAGGRPGWLGLGALALLSGLRLRRRRK